MRKAKYSKSLTLALSDEQYNKIKEISDEKQISAAEFTRELIQIGLNIQEKNNQNK